MEFIIFSSKKDIFLELKEISANFSKSVEAALNRMKPEGCEIWMLSRLKFKVKKKNKICKKLLFYSIILGDNNY